MVKKIRNVTKSLAGMEDLQRKRGVHTQVRRDREVEVHGIDVPLAVGSVAELLALDPSDYSRVRVYHTDVEFTDYVFDNLATTGLAPDGDYLGTWVPPARSSITLVDSVSGEHYSLTVANGNIAVSKL